MSEPELGRPNYSAGGARPAPDRGSPQPPFGDGGVRLELRAVLALAAALFAWSSWTPYYNLPIAAALVAAVLAVRWGQSAKRNILASDGARFGAGLADVARVLGLADLAVLGYLLFHYYFVAHTGIGGVMTLLFT